MTYTPGRTSRIDKGHPGRVGNGRGRLHHEMVTNNIGAPPSVCPRLDNELWSGVMTAGSHTSGGTTRFGWSQFTTYAGRCYPADRTFDYPRTRTETPGNRPDTEWTVEGVPSEAASWFSCWRMTLMTPMPSSATEAIRRQLYLHLTDSMGVTRSFNLGEGRSLAFTSRKGLDWDETDLGWSKGDVVCMQIAEGALPDAVPEAMVAITSDPGADDTYAIGDPIEVTATFSAAVTVTGTPQLALDIGGETREADYASGTGSTDLVFNYTVAEGDEDTNGIAITANSLTLNSGTIKAGTTDAALPHDAVAADADHKVDGVRPTLVSAVIAADALDKIVLTFNETLTTTTAATNAFTVTVDSGTAPTVNSVAASGATVTLTLASAVTDEQAVTVRYTDPSSSNDDRAIQDAVGNDADSFTETVTEPGTTPPTVRVTADPTTVSGGDDVKLDGTATDPNGEDQALTYLWTANPDVGSFDNDTNLRPPGQRPRRRRRLRPSR